MHGTLDLFSLHGDRNPEPARTFCRCCGEETDGGAYCRTRAETPCGEPVCRCGRVEPGMVELQLLAVPDGPEDEGTALPWERGWRPEVVEAECIEVVR